MARELQEPGRKIRVFLVDDEPLVRKGLRFFFGAQADLEVCGEAASEREALEGIQDLGPDLVVVDLTLKEGDGLSLMRRLRQQCPALRLLVFSMHEQAHFAASAFAAGAHGYVVKGDPAEQLLDAIHEVLLGRGYLSERIAAKAPGLLARAAPHRRTRPA